MDNNMIKIDDLLRQRLDGAEEQERPAAWLHMRDLLDKQMPVGKVPATGINWRRMFGYVAGLAILAAVSVGGYEMSESFSTQKLADNTTGKGNAAPTATTGLAGSAINSLPDTRTEAEAAQNPAPATDAAAPVATTTTTQTADHKNQNTNNNFGAANNTATNKNTNTVGNVTVAGNNNSTNNNTSSNNKDAATQIAKAGNNVNNNATQPAKAHNNKADQAAQTSKNTASGKTSGNNSQELMASAAGNATNNKPGNTVSQPANKQKGSSGTKEQAGSNDEGNYTDKTVHKIERQGKEGESTLDTVFDGKETIKVKQPGHIAAADNNDETSGGNINPAAAAPATKEKNADDAPMEKLGDHRTDSRKMKNYNPHRFEEMVQNAKYHMGQIKFYPGVVGGINAATNGNVGWHLGLAGSLAIAERWNILTEVKYSYKWNSAKENMQDDYITNVNSSVINGQSVYTYDSMEHYYNFTNYHGLELPVMLTYTNNRFVFLAGASLKYNFKIGNLQEVEQIYLSQQEIKTSTAPVTPTDKRVLLSDFSSSMNFGPVIGFGYMVAPSIRVDGRINQSLWNNSGSYGQKVINKSLYNMPQVQFNVSYRFSSNQALKKPRR